MHQQNLTVRRQELCGPLGEETGNRDLITPSWINNMMTMLVSSDDDSRRATTNSSIHFFPALSR